jgi:hypothetical protein
VIKNAKFMVDAPVPTRTKQKFYPENLRKVPAFRGSMKAMIDKTSVSE